MVKDWLAGCAKYLPGKGGPLVTIVSLTGVISTMGGLHRGLSLATAEPLLVRAFKPRKLAAVVLAVNSPGGSPVQSALIASRIRALATEKNVLVYAFCEDVAASGGYWLACAADRIYADSNSIVGSIGVVSGGFGFPELLKRYGIERRLHTSGERKAMLDPFSPEKPADIKHLKNLQKEIHDGFIAMVKERRGPRLKGTDKDLFSGAFWTGTTALELGLVDGLGDFRSVLKDQLGAEVRFRRIEAHQSFFRRKLGLSGGGLPTGDHMVAGLGRELIAAAEERLTWNRFGL